MIGIIQIRQDKLEAECFFHNSQCKFFKELPKNTKWSHTYYCSNKLYISRKIRDLNEPQLKQYLMKLLATSYS